MPSARPRLVRQAPLLSRIQAYLNPWDFLLWISEELNSNELEDTLKQWATPVGIVLNFIFMIARSNTGRGRGGRGDYVFDDYGARAGSGWLVWFSNFLVHFLTIVSTINALYTFTRKRHYRLFEASVEFRPNTPSARRVRVDSSPISSSPLRYLSSVLAAASAESRAYPDASKDVWELAVWDPTPFCLRLFTLFSPGHVLVYWLFLPITASDPRPSITVVTTIFLSALLSIQLTLLHRFFSQQSKDAALIHKEVQNEYDTKFVNPSLNRPVRDVGTQMLSDDTSRNLAEVETYTPTTYVNRGFRVNPNPNYASQYDPDDVLATPTRTQRISRPTLQDTTWRGQDAASGFGASPLQGRDPFRQSSPYMRGTSAGVTSPMSSGDGGHLGIYSQAHSPLKRPSNPTPGAASGRHQSNSLRQRAPFIRESSPLKASSSTSRLNDVQSPGSEYGLSTKGSLGRSDRLSALKGGRGY